MGEGEIGRRSELGGDVGAALAQTAMVERDLRTRRSGTLSPYLLAMFGGLPQLWGDQLK